MRLDRCAHDSHRAYTLVVVDVQTGFTGWELIVPQVQAELDAAKQLSQPVVIVEFEGYGTTANGLIERLANYPSWTTTAKRESDGSLNVNEACLSHGFSTANFRLCGLYAEHCVYSTAYGLRRLYPDSHIAAVRTACYPWKSDGWGIYQYPPRDICLVDGRGVPPQTVPCGWQLHKQQKPKKAAFKQQRVAS